jgi:hypothetical protein
MTRYAADPFRVIGKDRTMVHGCFRPNGATGIVTGSKKGVGFSVARTSAGLYTITLDSTWPALISASAKVRSADGNHINAVFGDYDASAGTIQMRVRRGAPVHVPLPISELREAISNDIGVAATAAARGSGAILCSDTTPILQRVNGATDKAMRVSWVANDVDEVQWGGIMVPRAAETANAVTVDLMLAKNTNTDTSATVDVQAWSGVGDTEMGAATTALASATLGKKTVTLTSTNVGAHPGFLNIGLVPSAHANDAIYLYAAAAEFETLVDLTADADNEIFFDLIMRNSDSNY